MRRALPLLRWVAALLGLLLFASLLRSLEAGKLAAALRHAGPWLLLALLPFLATVSADALGWLRLMRVLGPPPPFLEVLRIRLSLEALVLTLPGGGVIAESAGPALLASRCALPVRDGVVAVAARRWITLRAHAVYLAAGAFLGFSDLQAASQRLIGRPGLGVIALLLPLVPLFISLALEATLSRGSVAHAIHRKLAHLPGRPGRWFAARAQAFAEVDEDFQRFAHGRGAVLPALSLYLFGWAMESAETWLILRLLGAQVPFWLVLAFEPPLSLLRSAAFFLPAGLGAQDLGYLAFLGQSPQSFAFVAVKRVKELCWAAVGWGLLLSGKGVAASGAAPAEACA